ncbi:hypothetical protein M0802_010192 [Mischocyttarus mexicanus]|nr:hypothetical protein M0802_010192 [Mischocyttarus mexicanus]
MSTQFDKASRWLVAALRVLSISILKPLRPSFRGTYLGEYLPLTEKGEVEVVVKVEEKKEEKKEEPHLLETLYYTRKHLQEIQADFLFVTSFPIGYKRHPNFSSPVSSPVSSYLYAVIRKHKCSSLGGLKSMVTENSSRPVNRIMPKIRKE